MIRIKIGSNSKKSHFGFPKCATGPQLLIVYVTAQLMMQIIFFASKCACQKSTAEPNSRQIFDNKFSAGSSIHQMVTEVNLILLVL